ncbi:methyltransferase regulatory domain-containing protein [Pollutimonas bauzanensis]|uniref:Methyltransferase domain-containing protein n=1 Tax=Pollutimonas bauzanensis TaxID=658167 RepID=A0A1M6AXI7_9BURK|nr:methyltransferase regulatory domain-containing protein [Pollutimonas bauzanensis]SHI41195.1 Methyltransferase domain-containing protein [Pollutimonas bauzanensis]
MQADLDGYTGEVGYAERFHRGTAPAWLHFVAGGLGRSAPDPSRPYRWCELGCGPGLGAALLAAANPHAAFHAVDFNPAHISAGRAWAASAALGNLSFQQSSFADLAQAPAGQREPYDYIVLTGVYAWVSPSNQQAIRAFVRRFLAPGGLVYLSYPCYPGMTEMVPVRNLLREYARAADGDAPRRAATALAQLRALGHAGAPWLASRPELLGALDDAAGRDPAYLVHDLLAEHWQVQHVGQVVGDWTDGGCSWLGAAQPADNIDAIALPAQTGPLLAGLPGAALRESARAFAANQALRHDIYQRVGGPPRLDEPAHRQALLRQRLHRLPAPRDQAADARALAAVSAPYFGPLRQALAREAIRYDRCAAWPSYAAQPGELNAAFQLLAGAGIAHPILHAAPDPRPAQALNLALCRAALQGRPIQWLAAPALGSAISASLAQMAAWLALHEGAGSGAAPIADRAWQAWRRLSAALPARPTAAFAHALADFENEVLPCWLRLGVAADRRP